jgi:ferritin-like metal-binding protein YciE
MEDAQVKELVLQSLQHEMGGVKVYEAALSVAQNEDLKKEWQKYLQQTRKHVQVLEEVARAMELDPQQTSPGREIVAALGESLVHAIKEAAQGEAQAAELVACECVVLAETKDHLDWDLLGQVAAKLKGGLRKTLEAAHAEIDEEESEHLYHTRGWCRELWLQSLGLKAVLPPPEERRHVKTEIGAARAEQARRH